MLLRNRETERRLMSKKTRDDKSKNGPETAEPAPPRLSEALIAQLQQAVGAAQRRRNPERIDAPEIGSNEEDR